ncbi:unnamed protein product [Strongylus vulgaris]|uniref:Uncharacterized protein n=1 Tax=Strongylus vulgaris TaxID=40348 RepID=A0A3P7HWG0_STRVU|nr:unnamed protein product [Strongylus vulgaris]
MVTPLPTFPSGRATSPSKKEELRRKARQMLENPSAAVSAMKTRSDDDNKRREEARRLIEDAVTDGATYVVGPGSVYCCGCNLKIVFVSRSVNIRDKLAAKLQIAFASQWLEFRSTEN